jgi:hypothetical protein
MAFKTSNSTDLLYMEILTRIEDSLKRNQACVIDFLHYGITWQRIRNSVKQIAMRLKISFKFHYCRKGSKCTRCMGKIIPTMS